MKQDKARMIYLRQDDGAKVSEKRRPRGMWSTATVSESKHLEAREKAIPFQGNKKTSFDMQEKKGDCWLGTGRK